MWRFILRRLIMAIPVVFGISVMTFVLIYFLPADPARMYAGPSATVETVARIRAELGLDDPLWQQYGRYMSRLAQGDLGFSYRKQMPVTELIASRVPYTLALVFAGILVELSLGLPIGIYSALNQGRWPDRAGMIFALLGVSIPSFWLGLMLLYFFGYKMPIFPLGGAGGLDHLVLPAITAGLGGAAWYARMMRSSMLDVLSNDYVRTARGEGAAPWARAGATCDAQLAQPGHHHGGYGHPLVHRRRRDCRTHLQLAGRRPAGGGGHRDGRRAADSWHCHLYCGAGGDQRDSDRRGTGDRGSARALLTLI